MLCWSDLLTEVGEPRCDASQHAVKVLPSQPVVHLNMVSAQLQLLDKPKLTS